jgi:hypothetical protein
MEAMCPLYYSFQNNVKIKLPPLQVKKAFPLGKLVEYEV